MTELDAINAAKKLYAAHHGVGIVFVGVLNGEGEVGIQGEGGDSYDVMSIGITGRVKDGVEEIGDVKLADLRAKLTATVEPAEPAEVPR